MSTYEQRLLEYSRSDEFIKLLGKRLFNSPVYLCKSIPELNDKFEIVKDFIMSHLVSINKLESFDIGESTILPVIINFINDHVDALFICSSETISVVIDESDLSDSLKTIEIKSGHNLT